MYSAVRQERIVAEETSQDIVRFSTVQVIVKKIPEVQLVDRIREQIVEITKEDRLERVQQHTVEHIGDVPVPQTQELLKLS